MNTLKLLPRWCRILGFMMIIPAIGLFIYNPEIVFGDMNIFKAIEGPFVFEVPIFFDTDFIENGEQYDFAWIHWKDNDLSNEVLLTLMIIGTWLVAFSKIRDEDEFSKQLRLQSMVSAVVYNSILLLVLNFMIYDGLFLYIIISQLFSFLLLFSLIFALKVRKLRRGLTHEE